MEKKIKNKNNGKTSKSVNNCNNKKTGYGADNSGKIIVYSIPTFINYLILDKNILIIGKYSLQ